MMLLGFDTYVFLTKSPNKIAESQTPVAPLTNKD